MQKKQKLHKLTTTAITPLPAPPYFPSLSWINILQAAINTPLDNYEHNCITYFAGVHEEPQ